MVDVQLIAEAYSANKTRLHKNVQQGIFQEISNMHPMDTLALDLLDGKEIRNNRSRS